jgi:NAD(P)-dependent dehydrogenase (short-subunit alcohol dehydrogenase family)
MTSISWTLDDLGDLTGTTAVVTGGSRGVGQAVASLLRAAGAVVLTGARRDADAALDLADPGSVRAFADWVRSHTGRVDVLINNAGISNQPFSLARSGVEEQFAVNHLGHFLLTHELLPLLDGGRVVTVSSAMYPLGRLDLSALAEPIDPGAAYVRSKLAGVLFALELDRRVPGVRSLLAHPGLADTSMHDTYPDGATAAMVRAALAESGRTPEAASVGIAYAATATVASPGLFYGPDGDRLRPTVAAEPLTVDDPQLAGALWEASERLTHLDEELEPAPVLRGTART